MSQNFIFPCTSFLFFSPLCVAPISWIGGCLCKAKSWVMVLANSQILQHDRDRNFLLPSSSKDYTFIFNHSIVFGEEIQYEKIYLVISF